MQLSSYLAYPRLFVAHFSNLLRSRRLLGIVPSSAAFRPIPPASPLDLTEAIIAILGVASRGLPTPTVSPAALRLRTSFLPRHASRLAFHPSRGCRRLSARGDFSKNLRRFVIFHSARVDARPHFRYDSFVVGAASSAVRASGLHPEGPPFESEVAHHPHSYRSGCASGESARGGRSSVG